MAAELALRITEMGGAVLKAYAKDEFAPIEITVNNDLVGIRLMLAPEEALRLADFIELILVRRP